jgi:GNAT superfamily N-acetyltransferase
MHYDIRETRLASVIRIRHHILRPHQAPEETISPGDLHPDAIHLGAYSGESLIGALSAGPEPFPHKDVADCWRLRGLAVYPHHRGQGLGAELVTRIISLLRTRNCFLVWGLARLTVLGIYSRAGFRTYGEIFDVDRVGPHQTIVSQLREGNLVI